LASFFESQQLARRNTKLLVLMYALAVVGVILAVDLVIGGLYAWSAFDRPGMQHLSLVGQLKAVPKDLYLWGAAGTAALILLVSGWNVMKLGGGGAAVAEMCGARRVDPGTRDPLERRLVNVVEEMAIASGVRVPAVYVMDGEPGINAFAAGYEVSDSIVAVTRGTLETLNRDELQGVIGHEFSHIVNGDMRLNIRMIGVLAGIVFIGSVGEFLMRSQRGSSGDSKGAAPIFLAGLGLLLIGYIGLFFARLIKAAVSRQREFLADASSVQFTRNPDGIAGALDQIDVAAAGSLIAGRHAEDLSHMYFGQGIAVRLSGLFDTHPPVDERIERVHARFDRESYRRSRPPATRALEEAGAGDGQAAPGRAAAAAAILTGATLLAPAGRRGADAGAEWGRSAGESANLVGSMDGAKVDYAARLLAALPRELRESLRDAQGASAALVGLLLAPKEDVMKVQLEALAAKGLGRLAEGARRAAVFTRRLSAAFHMPVIDLALPAVKAAPEAAKKELLAGLEAVIQADRRVSLHEFVVLTMLRNQLAPRRKAAGSRKLADLQFDAVTLLSLVAHAGTRQDATGARADALQAAMRAGTKEMGLAEVPPSASLTLQRAADALDSLQQLAPMQKAILVKGLFATVSHDGTIRVVEAELMRLVGAVLDCPLPPLLETVDPATLAA
jgi:Zn-dependent protease with chaperone function